MRKLGIALRGIRSPQRVLFVLLAIPISGAAGLITQDTHTTDTNQQLDFLHFDQQTVGRDWNYYASGYTHNDGSEWRLASNREVLDLWNEYIPELHDDTYGSTSFKGFSSTGPGVSKFLEDFYCTNCGQGGRHPTYKNASGWTADEADSDRAYSATLGYDTIVGSRYTKANDYVTANKSYSSNLLGAWLVRDANAVPSPVTITDETHEDREVLLSKTHQEINVDGTFASEDQSIWGTGDAFVIDPIEEKIGLSERFDIRTPLLSSDDGETWVEAGITGGVEASFNYKLSVDSGHVDASVDASISTIVEIEDDGTLIVDTADFLHSPSFHANGPDGQMEAWFEYGAFANIFAGTTDEMPIYDNHTFFQLPIGSPGVEAGEEWEPHRKDIIPATGLYANGNEPLTYTLDGDLADLSLLQPENVISVDATEFNSVLNDAVETRGNTSPLIQGTLDVDAAILTLANAAGIAVPNEFLGGEKRYEIDDDKYFELSYELLDISLQADASIYQEWIWTPDLWVEVYDDSTTEKTILAKGLAGEILEVNLDNATSSTDIGIRYTLNPTNPDDAEVTTLRSVLGIDGLLTLDAQAGMFSFDAELGWIERFLPDGFTSFEFDPLWDPDPITLASMSAAFFDDTFRLEGFNVLEEQFTVDVYNSHVTDAAFGEDATGSLSLTTDTAFLVDGTAFTTEYGITLRTNSPTFLYTDTVIPETASSLQVGFTGIDIDPLDVFSIFINDDLIFSVSGEDIGTSEIFTDLISIAAWAGDTVEMTFALVSPDGVSSDLALNSVNFYSVEGNVVGQAQSNEVPAPPTPILLSLFAAAILLRRRRSGRFAAMPRAH